MKVEVSEQFTNDVIAVYEYGEEVFGTQAAISFVTDLYTRIGELGKAWAQHPECRHLPTPDKIYRNIILGSYLIIYRVDKTKIRVLRILHSRSGVEKIQSASGIE